MSEKIKDILLEHRGKKNAITSKQISKAMGFPMEDTQSVSRQAIWATADEEIQAFNDNYEKRISGIRKTQEMANKNYKEWKKKK